MKKRCLASVALILCLLCSVAFGGDLPWELRLPFKEATIQYELKGTPQGTETLYIKEYGKMRAKHHKATTTVMGRTSKSETIEITDPDWVSTYNLIERKGEKITNPLKLYRAEYNKFNAEEKKNFEKNSQQLGTSMMGKFGGTVTPNGAKILGYDCDVSSVGGMSTVSLLHGSDIPLRSEVAVMGHTSTVTATQIDTAKAIAESIFTPPAGLTATLDQEMENMMAETIKNTMDTLKRPDGAQVMQQQFSQPMLPAGALGGGSSADNAEQQQMMKQMEEAMQQINKQMKPQR